jgi:hypothetical protein
VSIRPVCLVARSVGLVIFKLSLGPVYLLIQTVLYLWVISAAL